VVDARPALEPFDPVVVTQVLRRLSTVPDWAVLKGWHDLPRLLGDLDAVARPSAIPHLARELAGWTGTGLARAVVSCPHLPGVPRFFVWLDGAGSQLLELDFVLRLTFRGVPLISYDRLLPHLVADERHHYRRTSPTCRAAVEAIFKQVGWGGRRGRVDASLDAAVLRDLAGPVLGPLVARSLLAGRSRPWALAASLVAAVGALAHPATLGRRLAFRVRGPVCSLDPRLGREIRRLGDDPAGRLAQLLGEPGHRLLAPPAGGEAPCA
jgi:hypothetical protein